MESADNMFLFTNAETLGGANASVMVAALPSVLYTFAHQCEADLVDDTCCLHGAMCAAADGSGRRCGPDL